MAAPRRYELVVFDWDGTLFDSTTLITRCIQSACRDLGLAVPSDADASYVIGLGMADAMACVAPGLPPERHPELGERFRQHYVECQHALVLFPGVVQLLHALKAQGQRLGVATGKSRRGLDEALASAQLHGLFDATRTADVTAPKPDPRMLRELMEELGVAADRTLMVGDTTHDLAMAAAAGADAVAVAYGAHRAEGFAGFPSKHVAHSVADLREWLLAHG